MKRGGCIAVHYLSWLLVSSGKSGWGLKTSGSETVTVIYDKIKNVVGAGPEVAA